MKGTPAIKKTQGTFAVPRYFIPEGSPAYAAAQKLFVQIKWRKQPTRANAIKNRFNAFSSLLWACYYWRRLDDLHGPQQSQLRH